MYTYPSIQAWNRYECLSLFTTAATLHLALFSFSTCPRVNERLDPKLANAACASPESSNTFFAAVMALMALNVFTLVALFYGLMAEVKKFVLKRVRPRCFLGRSRGTRGALEGD